MMYYVIQAAEVVAWLALFGGSFIAIMNGFFDGELWPIILGAVGLTIAIALAFYATSNSDSKPCAKYETMMQYNAATKTTMPMRYCALEGEWVK